MTLSCSFGTTVVFTTYAPGNVYNTSGSYTVGSGFIEGNLFQPSLTGVLKEIDFALSNLSGSPNVNIQLLTDNNNAPGTLIESYTVTATTPFPSTGVVVPALSTVRPILDAEKAYWLLLSSDSASNNPWYFNSVGATGMRYVNGIITPDSIMATFSVVDDPLLAPEPSSFFPLLLVLAFSAAMTGSTRRSLASTLARIPRP
jgi:hypothetical protein